MNSFQKDMKRIQKLVGSAYNKTGSLLALADGGQMSRKKLEQTLEQTAGFFEKAALEIRQLCERYAPGSFSFGRKPSAPLEMPTGHVNLAGCGWVHIQLDTLLPHCRYESPAWLTDTIRYMLTQYMTVANFPLRFKRMLLVIEEHSSIPGRHAYDQDNKGWKAVSNALKEYTGSVYKLKVYTEHSVQERSSGSTAAAYIGLEANGTMYWGAGTDTDIIKASASALIGAFNNMTTK